MLDQLLRHRILILLGKGGVGKTTLSAAIAWLAARRNGSTLAMECDERAPLAALLGSRASFSPIVVSPGLSVMVLEGGHALEEYLRLVIPARAIFHAVASSKLYQYFVQAAPGVRELMMLGKIYYEAAIGKGGKPHWDTVIFDAPSSGNALSLLRMPFATRETFGESLVGREASNIGALLRDPQRCGLIAVTTPEPMAIAETVETCAELSKLKLPLAAVILNRHNPTYFSAADVTRLKNSAALRSRRAHAQYLGAVASAGLAQEAETRRALRLLQSKVKCPIVPLADFSNFSGAALMARIAAELGSEPRDASVAT
ncbi:MAG TPA: ArsA family ATPase [Candidatus Binataceae bacterium]|jgi:anion-transporting  ArsA/GET3 family ATPase|nr:ArsA family ATPase [Candidatus Binataceae bacterium]